MNEENKNKAGTNHGGGILSRDTLYRKTAAHFQEALDVLVKSLSSRNEAIALGAANTIIDKCLPDVKAVEVTGENGEPIKLTIITGTGFVPQLGALTATSTASYTAISSPLQDTGLAPESPQDNNSNNGDSQTGTS